MGRRYVWMNPPLQKVADENDKQFSKRLGEIVDNYYFIIENIDINNIKNDDIKGIVINEREKSNGRK